jgi:ArsR family transcriptional regulator
MPVTRRQAGSLAALLKAVADDTRLRIVALLGRGPLCVSHLQTALQVSQPHASRHLAVLRAAGVVDARREGSWMHYQLARQPDPSRRRLIRALAGALPAALIRPDLDRLRRAHKRRGVVSSSG